MPRTFGKGLLGGHRFDQPTGGRNRLADLNPFLTGAADFVEALRRSRPHLKSLAVIGKEVQQASLIPSVDASVRKPLQADRTAGAFG